ncbi:probable mitochondrial import inner membrane translocase subunit Tim17 3 [Drosophila grimshawi]|uniref:GH22709 n=1 Tax=Drosophila grimshawi TaxID=7222 RepID=B4JSP2_DROGR|nr:probable mitochondrial import inner membrane translocase subunit Tim17 3 [Drosophila grimshawi]EDV94782.1 GH22709 [Drosophila grimshawi]
MVEYTRQPCPVRIVEDCGCAFMMGCIGGSMFQYAQGFRNAPTGVWRSLYGGLDAVKMKTPAIAGSFAVWGATFSTVDCTMVHYRQREDSWNSIVSGATTGGILAARNGLRAMANGALVGGLVLAMIEGAGVAVATIYAASANMRQQRPQWDRINPIHQMEADQRQPGNDALAEIERVLDKCNAYKRRSTQLAAALGQRPQQHQFINMETMEYAKHPPSLLELAKIANIFKTN